jgi:hypothetical protein
MAWWDEDARNQVALWADEVVGGDVGNVCCSAHSFPLSLFMPALRAFGRAQAAADALLREYAQEHKIHYPAACTYLKARRARQLRSESGTFVCPRATRVRTR